MAADHSETDDRRHRVRLVLATLRGAGISQHEIGRRTGVAPQYITDLKHGRRPLSELFARRLADEFDIELDWLLTGVGSMQPQALGHPASESRRRLRAVLLPIVAELVEGDPRTMERWDGSMLELTIPEAVTAAQQAIQPFVLRLGHGDRDGRLRVGDLLLISQKADADARLSVVRAGSSLRLARLGKSGERRDVETGRSIPPGSELVGRCVALLWSGL